MGFKQGADSDLVERASPIDMMELASDIGPVPLQVGAVLVSKMDNKPAPDRSPHLLSPILFPIGELPPHRTGKQAGHRQ